MSTINDVRYAAVSIPAPTIEYIVLKAWIFKKSIMIAFSVNAILALRSVALLRYSDSTGS